MAAAGHFADDQVESILIQSRDGGSPAAGPRSPRSVRSSRSELAGVHGVNQVTAPQWNADRSAALIDVHLRSTIDDARQIQARAAQIARGACRAPGPRGR